MSNTNREGIPVIFANNSRTELPNVYSRKGESTVVERKHCALSDYVAQIQELLEGYLA